MSSAKRNAITRLLESFPQTGGNYVVLTASFEERLTELSIEAVERAVCRFLDGDVPGQQKRFVPSVPEFVEEVRRCQDVIDMIARPRLPAPKYRPGPLAPFEMKRQKAFAENAHLPVLFEDVSLDQWTRLSKQNQIPVGAKWVAAIGVVYGPEPRHQIEGKAA